MACINSTNPRLWKCYDNNNRYRINRIYNSNRFPDATMQAIKGLNAIWKKIVIL